MDITGLPARDSPSALGKPLNRAPFTGVRPTKE